MRSGTNLRTREGAMRQGADVSGLAKLESVSSRRRTVMLALHHQRGVIREYQSDSSSKSPDLSAAFGVSENRGLEP